MKHRPPAPTQGPFVAVLKRLGFTILSGVLAGTLYAAFDIARFGRGVAPADAVIAALLAMTITIPSALVMALLLSAVFAMTGSKLEHRDWLAVMGGLAIVGPAFATSLSVNPEGSNGVWRFIGLASIPGAILCACLVRRVTWSVRVGPRFGYGAVAIGAVIAGALMWRATPKMARSEPTQAFANSTVHPNVVLIVLDTTRRDRFGCYGHEGGLTPVVDRLAAESVVYEETFSTAPWTVPSHASMVTGLYPVSHGCSYEHHVWLDDSFVTVQEHLGAAGYQTLALCSNFWVEDSNILQGFDRVISLEGSYDLLATKRLAYSLGRPARWVDKGSREGIEALSRWLRRERDAERPTFLFMNLFEAHVEYVPPAETRDVVARQGIQIGPALRTSRHYHSCLTNIEKRDDPELARTLSALYDAEIQYQDRRLGDILQLLRQHIPIDNTLIIVTSDHGENLGEAGRWEHLFAVNDILLHVPLVIRYPNGRWAGTRMAGLCQLVDLFSTILEVAGVSEEEKQTPGRSLVPDSFEPRRFAFAQVSPFYPYLRYVEQARGLGAGMGEYIAHYRAIRTQRYKYVWSSTGNHALYDILGDPLETVNRLSHEGEVAETLSSELLDFWAKQPTYEPPQLDNTPQPMDRRAIERLRSLGYVD